MDDLPRRDQLDVEQLLERADRAIEEARRLRAAAKDLRAQRRLGGAGAQSSWRDGVNLRPHASEEA